MLRFLFFIFCLCSLSAEQILWKGANVSLIEDRGLPAIVLNRQAALDELTECEKIEFERTTGKMQNVFERIYGFGDFIRWMPLEGERPISYLIPAGAYTGPNEVNYDFKIRVMLFSLRDRKEILAPLSIEQFNHIREIASELLPLELPSIPLQDRNIPCTNIVEGLVHAFKEVDEAMDLPKESPSFSLSFTTRCKAFCDPKILAKQAIADSDFTHVLYNYRPYVDCHLMLIPIRHISTLSECSDSEILDKFSFLGKVERIVRSELGYPKLALLTRMGWCAGQTQSHFHEHIIGFNPLKEQPWIRNWIYELNGTLLPIDPIEWEKIRNFFKSALTPAQ